MSCEARRDDEVEVGREEDAIVRGEAGTEFRSGAIGVCSASYALIVGYHVSRLGSPYLRASLPVSALIRKR